MMAMAGKITIAEVEELVEAGELDPDQIHTQEFMFIEFSKVKIMKSELSREL